MLPLLLPLLILCSSVGAAPHTGALSGDPTVSLTRTMSPLALLLVLGAASCSAQAATSAKLQSLLGNTGAK